MKIIQFFANLLNRLVRRESHKEEIVVQLDSLLLADIAAFSDRIVRNRRMSAKGIEAVDVYQEVVVGLLDRISRGETFEAICAKMGVGAHSDEDAQNATLRTMCINAAYRLERSL